MTIIIRPKVSIYIAESIDGYIAKEDGSLDWLDIVNIKGEDYGYHTFCSSIDTIVMGRKTYDAIANLVDWPYKNIRVIVLSTTLHSKRSEVELYSGPIDSLLIQLHNEGVKHVWVDGGETASEFIDTGYVDHIILSVVPVILGKGVPLFNSMKQTHRCRLVSSKAYSSGLLQIHYTLEH